jgi:indole-3-glycerol phosphate synthase
VQASSLWTAPTGTLGRIVVEARQRADALMPREAELARLAADAPQAPAFRRALCGAVVQVVAEVKRRSPSKGWINPAISAAEQASAYARGGAAAISVLTEPTHFGGSNEDLLAIRAGVSVPVLKKDFHVHDVQLIEARALGASAALLIARALAPHELARLAETARQLRLEVVIEVRDEHELQRALDSGATIVGINNRNLETLAIDPATSERLLALVPPTIVAVAESGVSSRVDVERVAARGADAVLVGSSVSAAPDPSAAVANLCGVERVARER